jgi:hypothetical protein
MFYPRNSKLVKIALAARITFNFDSCSDDDDDDRPITTHEPEVATLSLSNQVITPH